MNKKQIKGVILKTLQTSLKKRKSSVQVVNDITDALYASINKDKK